MKNNKTENERADRRNTGAAAGKSRRHLAAAAACGMLAAVGAGASAAYLTDGETDFHYQYYIAISSSYYQV